MRARDLDKGFDLLLQVGGDVSVWHLLLPGLKEVVLLLLRP